MKKKNKPKALVDYAEVHKRFEKLSQYKKHSDRIIYWTSLVVLTICNFVVAVALVPFLLVVTTEALYLIVFALGLVFGFLFNTLITDIEHLEKRHHVFAGFFIPMIGLLDLFIMVDVANYLSFVLRLNTIHSPLQVSLVYVLAFVIPYFSGIALRKKGR